VPKTVPKKTAMRPLRHHWQALAQHSLTAGFGTRDHCAHERIHEATIPALPPRRWCFLPF